MTDKKDERACTVPDEVTREIAVYGTKYPVIVKAFYNIDKMIAWMESRNLYLSSEINKELADNILTQCPESLELDESEVPKHIMEQFQLLKEYVKNIRGMKTLRTWRKEIDVWGRYHGSADYGRRLTTIGVPEDVWKLAINMNGAEPISFATVAEGYYG